MNLDWLFKPVSASSLAFIRIAMGCVALYVLNGWRPYILEDLIHSEIHFTYDFFHWVKFAPKPVMEWIFNIGMVSSVLFILGVFHRVNAVILWLCITYIFLLDNGHYNNHYYLYVMLLLFFVIVDADKWGAIRLFKKYDKLTIPYWQIFIFQLQIFVVYFYGGIAKMHGDWMAGFPMRFWLFDNSVAYSGWYADFLKTETAAYFYSYGGIIFDLSVGFLLLSRRTRFWILPVVLFFHVSNHFFWNIGSFPWTMIAMTTIFFQPYWAEKVWQAIKKPFQFVKQLKAKAFRDAILNELLFTWNVKTEATKLSFKPKRKYLVLGFIAVWFSFQFLFPLRRFIDNEHSSWTGKAHFFSWRMMLVDKVTASKMQVILPDSEESFYINYYDYINHQQYRKALKTSKNHIRFAHYIRDVLKENGSEDPIIKLQVWKSVNERQPRLMNDTSLNYARVEYYTIKGTTDWTTEWNESDEKPEFNLIKHENWQPYMESYEVY